HVHSGRLARPVRPEEPEHLAGAHPQIEVLDGQPAAVTLFLRRILDAQILRFQNRIFHDLWRVSRAALPSLFSRPPRSKRIRTPPPDREPSRLAAATNVSGAL